jgi:hypothetical protein
VKVELKTGAGVATLLVPPQALTPEALAAGAGSAQGAALSLDHFVAPRPLLPTSPHSASFLLMRTAGASRTLLFPHLQVDALASAALAAHDADGNASLEAAEFVEFARRNAFLALWFGPALTEAKPASTGAWREADLA